MNTKQKKLAAGLAALAAIGGLGYGAWKYRAARAELVAKTNLYITEAAKREDTLSNAADVRRKLMELAATTLGRDEESASAAVRSALNQIVEHHGMKKASVSTRSASPVRNPAAMARVEDFKRRDLRDQPDFLTLSATVTAEGSLEEALRAIATIQGQRWAHHVDSWSLRPEGKERERVAMSVTLTTLIVPGIEPRTVGGGDPPPLWTPTGDDSPDLWKTIASRDIFREPPPPAAPPTKPTDTVVSVPPPPPPPPGPPPLSEWRITGVAETPLGAELLLYNDRTGEAMVLHPGGTVQDLTFVRAAGDAARVRVGDQEFEVVLGATLADRKPTNP